MRTISYMFLLLVFCAGSSVYAEIGIGIGVERQTGWSDNFYLGNPDGWGGFVSKSLTERFSVHFSVSRLSQSLKYLGIMQFAWPPIDPDTPLESVRATTTLDLYELSMHYVLVDGSKMRLEVGAGLGVADFSLNLTGESTGKQLSVNQSPGLSTLSGEVIVKEFLSPPLSLRLGYKYRTMPTGVAATDSFEPFDDVKYSSIHAAVLARW